MNTNNKTESFIMESNKPELDTKDGELEKIVFALMEEEEECQKLFLQLTRQLDNAENNLEDELTFKEGKIQEAELHLQNEDHCLESYEEQEEALDEKEINEAKSQLEAWEEVIRNSDVIEAEPYDHILIFSEIENFLSEATYLAESDKEVKKDHESILFEESLDCIQYKSALKILTIWQSRVSECQSYEENLTSKIHFFTTVEKEMLKLAEFSKIALMDTNVSAEEKMERVKKALQNIEGLREDIRKRRNDSEERSSENNSRDHIQLQSLKETIEELKLDNAHSKEQIRQQKSLLNKFWINHFGFHWLF